MSYLTEEFNGVTIEEYVTGRIVRATLNGEVFKFYAQSEGTDECAIYIGHGRLNAKLMGSIRKWARERGMRVVKWGRSRDFATAVEP